MDPMKVLMSDTPPEEREDEVGSLVDVIDDIDDGEPPESDDDAGVDDGDPELDKEI